MDHDYFNIESQWIQKCIDMIRIHIIDKLEKKSSHSIINKSKFETQIKKKIFKKKISIFSLKIDQKYLEIIY